MEEESSDDASNNEDEDMQSEVLSASSMNLNEIDSAEKDAMDTTQLERFRQERENCQWPDEIETAHGMNARERFQRYRGLKSFRFKI
jgi:pre-rRNA-processing protein TSR1